MLKRAYTYRLKPTRAQHRKLNETLELCRQVYNRTLDLRKNTYEQSGRSLSLYATCNRLPLWKQEQPELLGVYSQVLQNAQVRVDLAFKAFFRRVKNGEKPGYPRFKASGRYDSFTYPQADKSISVIENGVKLGKLGVIKTVYHRSIEGRIKTVTVRRASSGKWYVSFSVEMEDKPFLPKTGKAVGIDVGLTHFATTSEDRHIANPRFFRRDEQALAKAQQRMEKRAKGTVERTMARKAVSRIHERIANRRSNFAHQESRKLVNAYDTIVLEKLDVKGMVEDNPRSLNKSIGDVAWTQFRHHVAYKAEEAGRRYIEVDPWNTTKRCSRCGVLVEKTLSERVHNCSQCGLSIDRDFNAALNILAVGLHGIGKIRSSSRFV